MSDLLSFVVVELAPCSGRPTKVTTPKMITKIHDIVLGDQQVK